MSTLTSKDVVIDWMRDCSLLIESGVATSYIEVCPIRLHGLLAELQQLRARPSHETKVIHSESCYSLAGNNACTCGAERRTSEKAFERLPRCDCDPDFGCRKLDPAQFICCLDEMERKAAASSEL